MVFAKHCEVLHKITLTSTFRSGMLYISTAMWHIIPSLSKVEAGMNNYIVMSYRYVIVVTNTVTRRTNKA